MAKKKIGINSMNKVPNRLSKFGVKSSTKRKSKQNFSIKASVKEINRIKANKEARRKAAQKEWEKRYGNGKNTRRFVTKEQLAQENKEKAKTVNKHLRILSRTENNLAGNVRVGKSIIQADGSAKRATNLADMHEKMKHQTAKSEAIKKEHLAKSLELALKTSAQNKKKAENLAKVKAAFAAAKNDQARNVARTMFKGSKKERDKLFQKQRQEATGIISDFTSERGRRALIALGERPLTYLGQIWDGDFNDIKNSVQLDSVLKQILNRSKGIFFKLIQKEFVEVAVGNSQEDGQVIYNLGPFKKASDIQGRDISNPLNLGARYFKPLWKHVSIPVLRHVITNTEYLNTRKQEESDGEHYVFLFFRIERGIVVKLEDIFEGQLYNQIKNRTPFL